MIKLGFATPQMDVLGLEEAERQIAALSRMGYEGVEYLINDPKKVDRARYTDLLNKYGIKISGLRTGSVYACEGWRLSHPDKKIRDLAVQRLKEIIELAGYFKTNIMVGLMQGHLGKDEGLEQAEEYIIEGLREGSSFALKYNVTIMFEAVNRFELEYHNTTLQMVNMVRRINDGIEHPVKMLMDVYHMHLEDPSIPSAFVRSMKYLGHVHFADSNRCAPGSGSIDFVEALKILTAMDYDGYVTMEPLYKPDMLTCAQRSIDFLKPIMASLK